MSDQDQHVPAIGLPHPDTDPRYARVRAALPETGAGLAPAAGWEARVWARIDAEAGQAREPGVRWGWIASGALGVAAAAALLLWQPWRGPASPDGEPAVAAQVAMAPSISIRNGAQLMRGTNAAPGDTLVVRHQAPVALVWIYLEDALVHEGGGAVDLVLERPGTYHVISTVGATRAPADLDAALAALVSTATPHHRTEIEVR